jgi:hypothetical protein
MCIRIVYVCTYEQKTSAYTGMCTSMFMEVHTQVMKRSEYRNMRASLKLCRGCSALNKVFVVVYGHMQSVRAWEDACTFI